MHDLLYPRYIQCQIFLYNLIFCIQTDKLKPICQLLKMFAFVCFIRFIRLVCRLIGNQVVCFRRDTLNVLQTNFTLRIPVFSECNFQYLQQFFKIFFTDILF